MTKRKYPKVTGYWVYAHRTPDNMYYPGQSNQQICRRWHPSQYRNLSLQPYIDQYGWDNIEHIVIKDGLTKEQALYWEDQLIQMYTEMGCCINHNRSGNIYKSDIKAYNRQYSQRPEVKEYMRQYNQRPEVKEYQRQYRQQPEVKEYMREYHRQYDQQPEVKQHNREYQRQRQSTPAGRIYNRVASYNHNHPDKAIETPMEAKQRYLETGYIPNYIKNNDIK